MENKVKYKIEADFEGWMWTSQEDVIPSEKKVMANAEHSMNVYRGHVTNIKMLDPADTSMPKSEVMLHMVHNIQIEPKNIDVDPDSEWPLPNPRIFDFYQFHLNNVRIDEVNFQKGIYSPKDRDKTYARIRGRLIGTILERRIDPPVPNPPTPPEEECVSCSQQVKSGGYGVDEQVIRLGKESGKTYIEFKPKERVDMLEIFYMGTRVWSTHQIQPNENGFVGGDLDITKGISDAQKTKWGVFDYIHKGDDHVTVRVTGKEPDTIWDYTLYCPNVVPPNAEVQDSSDQSVRDTIDKLNNKGCWKYLWYLLLLLLLLYILKQCTSLGRHAQCWYEKSKYERQLKEFDQEYAQTEQEIKDTEVNVQPCASKKAKGTNETDVQYFDLGDKPGVVNVAYDMFEAEDMIEIYYDGEMVGSSGGLVSGKGLIPWNYKAEKGRPTRFMVKMIPGPVTSTEWKYDLMCP